MFTISPGLRTGTRNRSTHAVKRNPFMGRSNTQGAFTDPARKAAGKVTVCSDHGALAFGAAPFGCARARALPYWFLIQVSSTNTGRSGSSLPRQRIQRSRLRRMSVLSRSPA